MTDDEIDLGTCAYYARTIGLPGADPKAKCSFSCHRRAWRIQSPSLPSGPVPKPETRNMTPAAPLVGALARCITRHQIGSTEPVQPPAWITAAATEIADANALRSGLDGECDSSLGLRQRVCSGSWAVYETTGNASEGQGAVLDTTHLKPPHNGADRMRNEVCDNCGLPVVAVRLPGGRFCSSECAEAFELS